MTKKQWLENMKSRKPDYAGLIKLRDKALLKYIVNALTDELRFTSDLSIAKLKRACKYLERFTDNVLGDSGTDFVLTRKDKKFLKEMESK